MALPTQSPDLPHFAVLDGGMATELVRQGFKDIDVSIVCILNWKKILVAYFCCSFYAQQTKTR